MDLRQPLPAPTAGGGLGGHQVPPPPPPLPSETGGVRTTGLPSQRADAGLVRTELGDDNSSSSPVLYERHGYLVTDKDLTEDGSDDRYLTTDKDSTKYWSDESPITTADAMEGGVEPWATSVGETSSPAECLDKRKLSDDWMKRSYHCRKIRRLQRDTVSLDLHVMVLQQEMARLYADQAEVADMMSDLKKFFSG